MILVEVIDLFRQCSPSDGSGRNYGIGSGFLASYLYHWKLRSELLETVIYVRINWRFFDLTAKLRCCCFRICTFQYFLLFDMITAIYLLGRCVRYKKVCAQLLREALFIHSSVKSGSQMLKLVRWLISFYKYRRYSVTITLQIEKYSLSCAHIGHDAQWKIKF